MTNSDDQAGSVATLTVNEPSVKYSEQSCE